MKFNKRLFGLVTIHSSLDQQQAVFSKLMIGSSPIHSIVVPASKTMLAYLCAGD